MRELRQTLVNSAVTAALFTGLLWAIGLDPLSSTFLGGAVLAAGAGRAVLRVVGSTGPDPEGRPRRRRIPGGVRNEAAELSWLLTPGRVGVSPSALIRLRRVATSRLAGHGIDLHDPADAARAQQHLGARVYDVLTAEETPRVRFGTFVRCLEAVESLPEPPPSHAHDHRQTASPTPRPAQEPRP